MKMLQSQRQMFFANLTLYILPTGIGKSRVKLFKTQFVHNGGKIEEEFSVDKVTHVVVDESIDWQKVSKTLKWERDAASKFSDIVVAKTQWLSGCLKAKELIDISDFILKKPNDATEELHADVKDFGNRTKRAIPVSPNTSEQVIKRQRLSSSDYESDNVCADLLSSDRELHSHQMKPLKESDRSKWILANAYKNTKDEWRALGYKKAIAALSRHPHQITTWEEAKAIRGVGERLADKIYEIIQSGHLRKIDEVCIGERMAAINLFTELWGAGPTTAEQWVQQGYRSLEDLRNKAKLTNQQKIGLKYYYEILERMPREEAAEIECEVRKVASSVKKCLEVVACGSYRRGKATCGDVDILITHPDGKSHKGLFHKVLDALHKSDFLTDDLVVQEDNGRQQKYLGVCMLKGQNRKHRRLDIIVVPYDEFACALMYFTGSAHFNRSMRHLAKCLNMSLTEHSLNAGVKRDGKIKVSLGHPLSTPTEKSIFEHLKIPYRAPSERDH